MLYERLAYMVTLTETKLHKLIRSSTGRDQHNQAQNYKANLNAYQLNKDRGVLKLKQTLKLQPLLMFI